MSDRFVDVPGSGEPVVLVHGSLATINAPRSVIEGAGHEIRFTGEPSVQALRSLWRTPAVVERRPSPWS